MAYSNGWNSTDQVAQRAIDQGMIGRFGSLDPTDGGVSSRFSLSSNWAQSSEYGQSKVNAYVDQLGAAALQQFHLLPRRSRQWRSVQPDRPAHGLWPQRQPRLRCARRPASRRKPASALQTRGDDIHVGLFKTLQRETLSTVREDSVQGRQCRPVGRYDGALDRLAAHHGRHPRGLFCGERAERHAAKFRQRAGVDDEPEGRHRARPLVQDRVLRQCRLRPALQRYQGRDDHRRSHRQGDAAGSCAAAGAIEGRRDRRPHQGDRRPHQFARGVRAGFRLRTAVRRRCRHHRAEPPEPARRRRVDQPVSRCCRG